MVGSGKKAAAPSAVGANPYLAARREYDERFSHLARGRARWQAIAFLLCATVVAMAFQLVRVASQSSIAPYVVEVDRDGAVIGADLVERMVDPSDRMVVSELTRFVAAVRQVSSDPLTQRQLSSSAFSYVDGSASSFLNRYFGTDANNPILLGRSMARLVDVNSVLAVPNSAAWKVEWTETVLPLDDRAPSTRQWEGYFTLSVVPPRSTETIYDNPLGLTITDINWTAVTPSRSVTEVRGR